MTTDPFTYDSGADIRQWLMENSYGVVHAQTFYDTLGVKIGEVCTYKNQNLGIVVEVDFGHGFARVGAAVSNGSTAWMTAQLPSIFSNAAFLEAVCLDVYGMGGNGSGGNKNYHLN